MLTLNEVYGRKPLEVVVAGPLSRRDLLSVAGRRICVAVNRGLQLAPALFSHYVSYHSENITEIQCGWIGVSWVQRGSQHWNPGMVHLVDNMFSGGSSGLFGVSVALQYLGATRVYLSGVALDDSGYHLYRQNWRNNAHLLRGCVTAVTDGWVKRFLEGKEA